MTLKTPLDALKEIDKTIHFAGNITEDSLAHDLLKQAIVVLSEPTQIPTEVLEALKLGKTYIETLHNNIKSATGLDQTLISPDLEKVNDIILKYSTNKSVTPQEKIGDWKTFEDLSVKDASQYTVPIVGAYAPNGDWVAEHLSDWKYGFDYTHVREAYVEPPEKV